MSGQILVIEDEPGIVDFLQRGFAAYGYEVESAVDGDRPAATRALGEPFDLVVLDLMLPGRSGLEVLERIHDAKPGAAGDRADGPWRGGGPGRRVSTPARSTT